MDYGTVAELRTHFLIILLPACSRRDDVAPYLR